MYAWCCLQYCFENQPDSLKYVVVEKDVYFQRDYRSETLIEIWICLKPSVLMPSRIESMPCAATCQCGVNMILVSCCLPVMCSTLHNFCWVFVISHYNILLRWHGPIQQYHQITKRCGFVFALYCNQNNPQSDAFLPTSRSRIRAKPALSVNKKSSYKRISLLRASWRIFTVL